MPLFSQAETRDRVSFDLSWLKNGHFWRELSRRQEGTKEILLVLSGLFLISKVN